MALNQIRVQKLKSFFTLVGVMIGVMFLIAVVSIVEGMGRYMERDLIGKIMAINTFELRRRPNVTMGGSDRATWEEYMRRPRLYESDVPGVIAALPAEARAAVFSSGNATVSSRYANAKPVDVRSVTRPYFDIKKLGMSAGRPFSEQEDALGVPVVVIGKDVSDKFFPNVNPLDRQLRIGLLPYTVIGVAESQGSALGMSLDKFVIVPFSSPARRLYTRRGQIESLMVQAPNATAMQGLQDVVRQVMRARHKLRPGQKDDFSLETSESALAFWNKLKGYLVLAGIVLPAIGLVVGAIVIMNIMLVAVAERTREIGIRKSLGARRRDILSQFLIEAATLSTFGAALGVGLGALLAFLIATLSPLPTQVAPWSVAVAVLLGAGVGIVAGVYPASRAARLDPIAALRSD